MTVEWDLKRLEERIRHREGIMSTRMPQIELTAISEQMTGEEYEERCWVAEQDNSHGRIMSSSR
jgi:hypothetical protein